jgi:hypothetical protein
MVGAVTNGDAFTDWLASDSWLDFSQQRSIRALRDDVSYLNSSLSSQMRESGRLRSELSKLQGSVESRLNRLARSFDAFVELSDLRMTLALFDPPALVRHRTRQLIAAAGRGDQLPSVEIVDVPGYWLAPAVVGLVGLLRGEAADAPFAQAVERDPVRTALLVTLACAVAGRPELASSWLPRAFGPLPAAEPVTRVARALWTEAAEGTFGPEGRALLATRLTELVASLDPQQEAAAAEDWRARVGALAAPVQRPVSILDPVPAAERAMTAGARLATLRTLCVPAENARDAERQTSGELVALLRALVDEGTAEEAPLMRRAAELRAVIEDRAQPADRPWDAPLQKPLDLLRADAFATDGARLATMARAAGARWLLASAEKLATEALTDPPTQAATAIEHVQVVVRTRGRVDAGGLAEVNERIDSWYPDQRVPSVATIAVLAVGVLLTLSVVAAPNVLAILATVTGVVLLAIGAGMWLSGRRRRADFQKRRANARTGAQQRAERAATQLADVCARLTAAGEQATADLAAIKSALSEPAL